MFSSNFDRIEQNEKGCVSRCFSIDIRKSINMLPVEKLLYNITTTIRGSGRMKDCAFKVSIWSNAKLNS